jgi:hypothetical protein
VNNAQKPFQMKNIIFFLVALISISLSVSSQSTGDYRSVSSGNWNDPSKWEMYNGSNWVAASTYPGQNSGTGAVTISVYHLITITASVPQPVASVSIQSFFDEYSYEYYAGTLSFSAENAVSLNVSGTLDISGTLYLDDRTGSKSHALFIGGSLSGNFNGINGDDKINVVFNSNVANSVIGGGTFQDVTFNGSVFTVQATMFIHGNISFLNGIVNTNDEYPGNAPEYRLIRLRKGATWSGASNTSHINGWVAKEGDEPFTFPVGKNGFYAPLTISALVGQSEIFFARYNRASGSELAGITDPGLFNVSPCEYWDLMSSNGYAISYPLSITVGWNGSSGCGRPGYITNVSEVTLAHSDRTTWNSHGGSATGTAENGSVTWSGVSALGPFTIGNIGTCKTPLGLSATSITGNSATLSWSQVNGAVSYDVYYATFPAGLLSYWTIAATGTTLPSVNLSLLNQATKYYYKVRANCSEGSSFRQSDFTTLTVCEKPTPSGTGVTSNSATLSWLPVPGAISYHLEYQLWSVWYPVNSVITSTTYTLTGLGSGHYYNWHVRANCPLGYSYYSDPILFWTPNPPACDPPTGLTASNITNVSVMLSWAAVAGAISYYVEYMPSNSSVWQAVSSTITSTSYILGSLTPGTGYLWRVRADCGSSSQTNFAQSSFTTANVVLCNDVYETNETSIAAKAISIGTVISAAISSATDVDWFKITTPNNSNTNLEVRLSALPANYDLYVYNNSLKLVGSSALTGISNEVVTYNSNSRKTTYYIKVVGANGAYNSSQCYNLFAGNNGSTISSSRLSDPAIENEIHGSENSLLYPNPASEFVLLRFNSFIQGTTTIELLNSIGQLVKQQSINLTGGNNLVQIMVTDTRPGIYLVRIRKPGLNIIKRLVIVR